jgi:uncharacterized integral membrane protein
MRIIKTIILTLLLAVAIVFTIQNYKLVEFKFLNWIMDIPLSLACIFIFIIGVTAGGVTLSILRNMKSHNNKENDENFDDENSFS